MDNKYLKKIISKLPSKPGIYLFKGKGGNNIYIGKAGSIKSRVLSYLKTEDVRIKKMLETAQKLEFKTTDSDIEALILESQYIKKCRPMFNIVMRDDKQYFYVGFTDENFPKVFITHQSTSFGPFTDGGALKATLRYLRNIFPYCTCKQKHNNYCLNYHIGKCLGFCCLKQQNPNFKFKILNFKTYKKNVKAIKDILSGRKKSLLKKLEKEMVSEAKNNNFEEAIKIRTKLERLRRIFENAKIIENLKFKIGIFGADKKDSNTLKQLQKLLNIDKPLHRIEAYDISNIQGQNATGSMVVFENGKPDKNEYRKFKIRSTCNVKVAPTSQVRGDTDMLREVLTRRFNHPEWRYPDLIVIDGGKGQLSAAKAAILNFKLQILKTIPVVALTKNTKHLGEKITLANKKSVSLSALPENVKNLILAIDAEAHRFAISYHRKLHRKNSLP